MSDDPTLSQQSEVTIPVEIGAAREHWGPFLLRERVGHGAFGEVYRAWDPNLEREALLQISGSRSSVWNRHRRLLRRRPGQIPAHPFTPTPAADQQQLELVHARFPGLKRQRSRLLVYARIIADQQRSGLERSR